MNAVLIWILLYIVMTRVMPILPGVPDFIYYGVFLGCFLRFVVKGKMNFSYGYLPFMLAIFISVYVNDIPSFYRIPFRLLAFFSLAFAIGPFFDSMELAAFRRKLFVYVLLAIRMIVLLSFAGWLLRLPIVHGYSGFIGLTRQSMLLGPLAGISVIYAIYRFYQAFTLSGRYMELGIGLISLLVLLLAGSRSALGSTMLGVVFFFFRMYRFNLVLLVRACIAIAALILLTLPLWIDNTKQLQSKMEYGEKQGSLTYSRDRLWQDRVAEFSAFPVFGVGFASFNLEYIEGGKVNMETGTVEPGSSWLFLLSSLGSVGFMSFLIPVLYLLYFFYTDTTIGINAGLLGALLILFCVHMFFEGYIVASGSFLCFFLWILLSQCYRAVLLARNL